MPAGNTYGRAGTNFARWDNQLIPGLNLHLDKDSKTD